MSGISGLFEIYAGSILILLFFGTVFLPHYRDSRQRAFIVLLASGAVTLIMDGLNYLSPIGSQFYVVTSIVFRMSYYVMFAGFGFYTYESLRGEGSIWPFWTMLSVPVAATSAILYEISGLMECNILQLPNNAKELEMISNLGDYLIMFIYLLMITGSFPVLQTGKMLVLLLSVFIPFTASIIGQVTEDSGIYLSSVTLTMIILYVFDYNVSQWRYATRLAVVADQRSEMVEQGLKIDFILDSLDNIEELSAENPIKTGVEAKALRDYIAHTVESLREVKMVTFARELAAIKQMIRLENFKIDDGRSIEAEYSIEDTSFKVPSLSIRMLVENSVASLLATDREERRLWISVWERSGFYEVEIRDNGLTDPEHDPTIGEAYVLTKDLASRQLTECSGAQIKVLQASKAGRIFRIKLPGA